MPREASEYKPTEWDRAHADNLEHIEQLLRDEFGESSSEAEIEDDAMPDGGNNAAQS